MCDDPSCEYPKALPTHFTTFGFWRPDSLIAVENEKRQQLDTEVVRRYDRANYPE